MPRNRRNSNKKDNSNEPEEYEVERIESHRVTYEDGKPSLSYFLKWKNFSAKDNTWEPSESVHATGLIDEYWNLKGGKEQREKIFKELEEHKEKSKKRKRSESQEIKKNNSSKEDSDDEALSETRSVQSDRDTGKKIALRRDSQLSTLSEIIEASREANADIFGSDSEFDISESEIEEETFRIKSDWSEVLKVEGVRPAEDDESKLYAIIRWNDGKVAKYPTSLIAKKAPIKLIDYYEKRLLFEQEKS